MNITEKLQVAWKRVKIDRKTDFIIGDFEYSVYDYYSEELISNLAERFKKEKNDYKPKPLRKIRVPKQNFTSRPGALPEIDDRILYQMIVDELAEQVEQNLIGIDEKVLHSYRYCNKRKSERMFKFDTASYNTFVEKTNEIAETQKYIVITDIASYFERIYHHNVGWILEDLGASNKKVNLLLSILRKWTKGNSFGIPQGIWPSDYIGNIHLDPIDKYFVRLGYNYCRYVDDIRVGADSYLEAKTFLVKLEKQLEKLGLSLNPLKTKIIESGNLEEELFPYKYRFDEIFQELKEELPFDNPYWEPDEEEIEEIEEHIHIESIIKLFREELEKEQPNPHICRFCLKKFKAFADIDVLQDVLENLDKLLLVLPRVANYLITISKYLEDKSEITNKISSNIDRKLLCYDWQLMWYLYCLNKIGCLSHDSLENIRGLILKNNCLHEAVIVNATLLIGKHGDNSDKMWLTDLYDCHNSLWVKRAILYSLEHMSITKRNHFYSYCKENDNLSNKIIDYIKSK